MTALGSLSPNGKKLAFGALVGGVVGLAAAAMVLLRPSFAERAEYVSYDPRARALSRVETASRDIVMVDIADEDIQLVEDHLSLSWPWPRELHAYLIDFISAGGAKAVAVDFIFQDRGDSVSDLATFADLLRKSGRTVLGVAMPAQMESDWRAALAGRWGASLATYADEARARQAALQLQSWNVRTFLVPGAREGGGVELLFGGRESAEEVNQAFERILSAGLLDTLLPEGVAAPALAPRELSEAEIAREYSVLQILRERDGIALTVPAGMSVPRHGMMPPVAVLGAAAARLGNVVQHSDSDGVLRRHLPFLEHAGRYYPSLSLATFLVGNPEVSPRLDAAGGLVLGERRVALDAQARFPIRFASNQYRHVSSWSILRAQAQLQAGEQPSLSPATFKDKYVIVSAVARALRDVRTTPVLENHPGAEVNAAALDNFLTGRTVERLAPAWDAAFALALALLLSLAVVVVWSFVRSTWGALLGAFALVVAGGLGAWELGLWLLRAQGVWLSLTVPLAGAAVAVVGSLLATNGLERHDRRFVQEALGRYTSPVLVRELLSHPEYLSLEWGEVRPISVYFSDIANFTSFSEALPPDRLVRLLNDYLTNMTDLVLENGGVVDKYIGDAIMAFWGAPLPNPEHARLAVRSAIAMRRRCELLRPKWQAEFGPVVISRAGINTGQAVSGNMGSKHKFNYTVMGDTVNLASRLEGANKPYGTVLMISESCWEQAREAIEVRELDLLAVKGKQQPVRVFEVLEEKGRVDPRVREA
ncbi:MAG: adenylate/guanylate cyclase domain-containing protein, partial [Deltaproteobacteria bacterium]|nr:adenylate/guanylate cyclase domain-containing protein [Deltaproteobacteria bacterium]